MGVRCKACFKKYESHYPVCPHCGQVNDRDEFSTDVQENLNQTHVDVTKDKVIDGQSKVAAILKNPHRIDIVEKGDRYCQVCGTENNIFHAECMWCGTYINDSYAKTSEIKLSDRQNIRQWIKDTHKKANLVDLNIFSNLCKEAGIEVKQWRPSGNLRIGIRGSGGIGAMLGGMGSMFIFLSAYNSLEPVGIFLTFFLFVIPAIIASYFIGAYSCSERLDFTYYNGILTIEHSERSRDTITHYEVKSKDLKCVRFLYDEGFEHLRYIEFQTQNSIYSKTPIYRIDVSMYTIKEGFFMYILLAAINTKFSVACDTVHGKSTIETDEVIEVIEKPIEETSLDETVKEVLSDDSVSEVEASIDQFLLKKIKIMKIKAISYGGLDVESEKVIVDYISQSSMFENIVFLGKDQNKSLNIIFSDFSTEDYEDHILKIKSLTSGIIKIEVDEMNAIN